MLITEIKVHSKNIANTERERELNSAVLKQQNKAVLKKEKKDVLKRHPRRNRA